jgi:hypothetical protein
VNRRFIASLVGAFALLLLSGCELDDRNLTLAHTTEEPAPTIAETVRAILDGNGFTISIEETADPAQIMTAISERRLDLAIIEEPDRPQPGIITLTPLYPSVLHVLHDRPGHPEDFADLIRGAKVYAGPPGGAAYRLLMELADDFDLASDDLQLLDNPWIENPNVFFIFGGLLSPESIDRLAGYRLFSFAGDGDAEGGTVADGIALRHHHLRPFLLPKGVYKSLAGEAILTLSIRTVLIANEKFDAELAYDIASALFVSAQEISLDYPLVTRELNEDMQVADLILPIHEGSRRFLDRDRPGLIERNAEVIALCFTVFITLISGALALYRHRMQVRKDRVDTFFGRLLEIRHQMADPDVDFVACKDRVLDVQGQVLDLLVNEKIAADASLIAFMSHSNQILDELDRHSRG